MPPTETDTWFVNDYEMLELTPAGNTTDVVAGIRGVTLEAEFQTLEEMYTADSTKRVTVKQAQAGVPVSVEFAFFDGSFVEQWLGGESGTATSLSDTSDPALFELSGDFRNDDGSQKIDVEITDIYFENIPMFDGSMDEFATWGLDGSGADVTNFEYTTVA
jgi:hypothetical protein